MSEPTTAYQLATVEEIDFIPLSDLTVSSLNMRTDHPDPATDGQLKASLLHIGVLQYLIVHKEGKKYGVAAGGRRLRLLQELVKEQAIHRTYQVPCRIVPKENAVAMSLAEEIAHETDERDSQAILNFRIELDEFMAQRLRPSPGVHAEEAP